MNGPRFPQQPGVYTPEVQQQQQQQPQPQFNPVPRNTLRPPANMPPPAPFGNNTPPANMPPPAPFGNNMPPVGPGCPPGAGEAAVARLCSSGYAVLFPFTCKLVGFSCEILSTETATDYWIFLFDGDVTKYIASNTPIPSIMIKATPKKIAIGEERSFASKTKWTPFDSALSVGISTSDAVFTIASSCDFWAYYHVISRP